MSITLTIYDLLANLIPGLLYLYVINETLLAFNQRAIDLSQLDSFSNLVLAGLAAFVCGHLANSIIYRYWFKVFMPKSMEQEALTRMRARNPDIKISFKLRDDHLLMSVIRHHTPSIATNIEMHMANSIMMRNISLGTAMFAALQIIQAFRTQQWASYLVMAVIGIAAAAMALNRAEKFDYWYHREVLYEAINYGSSADEVLALSRKLTAREEVPEMQLNKPARKKSDTR